MLGIVEVSYFPPLKKSNLQSASECCVDILLNESNTSELGPETGIEAASTHTGSEQVDISAPIPVSLPVPIPVPDSLLRVSAVTSDDANIITSLSISVNSAEEITDNAEQIPVNSEESVALPEPMFR